MDNKTDFLLEKLQAPEGYTIGNDLVYLPDFVKTLNEAFIHRVYTETEIAYAEQFATPHLRYASSFAAKEAVFKALKQYDSHLTLAFNKIEIRREKPAGQPSCLLHYPTIDNFPISLSISHDGDYVWAIALVKVV